MTNSRRFTVATVLLVLLTIVGFAPATRGPQLFDDRSAIQENASITRLWPITVPLSPPADRPVAGRPVANLTYAINYAINRVAGIDQSPDPGGKSKTISYHIVNLLLHIGTGLLLLGIVRRTLRNPKYSDRWSSRADWIALGITTLWLLHPIQTAAVDYLSQRTELLGSFFFVATLYSSVRVWDAVDPASEKRWFTTAIAASLLGMGSKEIMVGAPLMVLLYDRAFRFESWRAWRAGISARRRTLYFALFATLLVLVGLNLTNPRSQSAGFRAGMPWYVYLNSQGWALPHYLQLFFWPSALTFDYGPHPLPLWQGAPGLAFVALLGIGVVWCWTRERWTWLGFAGTWFFVLVAPSSSIVPLLGDIAAERRVYLALVSVIIVAVMGVIALAARLRTPRAALWALAPGVLMLTAFTFKRSELFRSAEAIWRDAAAKRPENFRAWTNLGAALIDTPGGRGEAYVVFRRARELDSADATTKFNLGVVDYQLGRYVEAEEMFRQVLRVMPNDPRASDQLADVLLARQDFVGAIPFLDQVAGSAPEGPAPMKLAMAELSAGRVDDAIKTLQLVVQRQPQNSEALRLIGALYSDHAKPDSALQYLQRALAINPASHATFSVLSMTFARLGRVPEAVRAAEQATERNVATAPICTLVGQAMLMVNRVDLAGTYFECSLQLQSQNPDALVGLGTVKAREGDKQMARTFFQQAVAIDSSNSEARAGLAHLGTKP